MEKCQPEKNKNKKNGGKFGSIENLSTKPIARFVPIHTHTLIDLHVAATTCRASPLTALRAPCNPKAALTYYAHLFKPVMQQQQQQQLLCFITMPQQRCLCRWLPRWWQVERVFGNNAVCRPLLARPVDLWQTEVCLHCHVHRFCQFFLDMWAICSDSPAMWQGHSYIIVLSCMQLIENTEISLMT